MPTSTGTFITFEGSESCGKSTQSRLLVAYLRGLGLPVVFLREPGGTVVSEKIRKILLDNANGDMCRETELLLYMASRAQTVREVIQPALVRGRIVVCDRFLDSTVVYQGYGLGMDLSVIRSLGDFVTGGTMPGLTILLDYPLKRALDKKQRKDRIEQRPLSYHRRVKRGYLELARRDPGRIRIVRLEETIEATQKKIRGIVEKALAAGRQKRTGRHVF